MQCKQNHSKQRTKPTKVQIHKTSKSFKLDMDKMEFSLPPSANWYCTQALDVSSNGIIAYGSMRECVVIDPLINEGTPHIPFGVTGSRF